MPKTEEFMFLMLPKGLEFEVNNPQWSGDDPKTHYQIKIRLEEDAACYLTGGNYEYSIIEKEIKK